MKKTNTLIDEYHFILSLVTDWLKFAENKNGALLAADSGLLLASISLLFDYYTDFLPFTQYVILVYLLLITLAIILNLVSFIPTLNILNSSSSIDDELDSLIYFKSIANFNNHKEYFNSFKSALKIKKKQLIGIEKDYANQIFNISQITIRKFKLFNFSLAINLVAISILLIYVIFCLITGIL